MSITQNEKIRQVTEQTLVVGVDIASEVQWARAFDWRGIELGKVISFENTGDGFVRFTEWLKELCDKAHKTSIIIGAEPTGHYWFTLGVYLRDNGLRLVLVNPYHVKRSKELDDNHPSKSDRKDPKTIAKLVIDGRYSTPYIPEGVYAELRVAMNCRWRILCEVTAVKNQIQRWLKIYFPEHKEVFGDFECISSMAVLRKAPLPTDVMKLGSDGINQIWRDMKLRAVGKKRATQLYDAAKKSIGCTDGLAAALMEMHILLEDYAAKSKQCESLMEMVAALCEQIPGVAELVKITGVGLVTVAGVLAEVGNLGRFNSPRQIQKLAGLAICENSSGKFRGQTTISKRGRSRLRAILFRAAIALAGKNPEFRELHQYYTTRANNPLKKKQSIIALCCKLIRIFHVIAVKGYAYDAAKMLADIHRNPAQKAA